MPGGGHFRLGGQQRLFALFVGSSGWAHTWKLNKNSSRWKLPSKIFVTWEDLRPDWLQRICVTKHARALPAVRPEPIQPQISTRTRSGFMKVVNQIGFWPCIGLWVMPQAWRHVKPIHFRYENIISIIFTKDPHFHHRAFIDRYEKANYCNQNQIFKKLMKKSFKCLGDTKYILLCVDSKWNSPLEKLIACGLHERVNKDLMHSGFEVFH